MNLDYKLTSTFTFKLRIIEMLSLGVYNAECQIPLTYPDQQPYQLHPDARYIIANALIGYTGNLLVVVLMVRQNVKH